MDGGGSMKGGIGGVDVKSEGKMEGGWEGWKHGQVEAWSGWKHGVG